MQRKKNGDGGCVILRHADAKKIMWNPLKDRRRVLPELFGSKRIRIDFVLLSLDYNFTTRVISCNFLT